MSAEGQVQKKDDIDIGGLAVKGVTYVIKNRPITVSTWVVGLLLAAFANGFTVDDATTESYQISLQHAEEVHKKDLVRAFQDWKKADERHYNSKGWFWACDGKCQKNLDKANMAKADMNRVQKMKDDVIRDARREVGIWSTFGVQDVRNSFWSAWQSGKDFAARYTMMDAMFMMIGGKEETAISMIIKLVFQYMVNLTMGLMGAFCFFMYNVYTLVISYGESMTSGLAFFLLVFVAGLSTIGTYLFAIMGTVVGGGAYIVKQAAEQQRLQGAQGGGGPRRQVQYGGGTYGGGRVGGGASRAHYD